MHVTLRAVALGASLRSHDVFDAVHRALGRASTDAFRSIHFSVQRNHVHLIVEPDSRPARTRGIQGLAIRVAKAVNRVLGRRGTAWSDRHHTHVLATPHAVRHALVYVLQNFRKHGHGGVGTDTCSSARGFSGWRGMAARATSSVPVMAAGTWLAA